MVGGTHYAGNHFQQEVCVNADGVPAEASYANLSPRAAERGVSPAWGQETHHEKKDLQPDEAARRKQTRHVFYPCGAASAPLPV